MLFVRSLLHAFLPEGTEFTERINNQLFLIL